MSNKVEFPCINCLTRTQCTDRYTSNPDGTYIFLYRIKDDCPMFKKWYTKTDHPKRCKMTEQVFGTSKPAGVLYSQIQRLSQSVK